MINPVFMLAQVGSDVGQASVDLSNPVGFVEQAAQAVPGIGAGVSAPISIVLLLTVLSLAPSILILCTCFTRFVVCWGFFVRHWARRDFRQVRWWSD